MYLLYWDIYRVDSAKRRAHAIDAILFQSLRSCTHERVIRARSAGLFPFGGHGAEEIAAVNGTVSRFPLSAEGKGSGLATPGAEKRNGAAEPNRKTEIHGPAVRRNCRCISLTVGETAVLSSINRKGTKREKVASLRVGCGFLVHHVSGFRRLRRNETHPAFAHRQGPAL